MENEIYDGEKAWKIVTVIDKGKRGGFYWAIISMGSHPCCYVGVPPGHKYYGKGYDSLSVDCHGGLTFAGKDLHMNPIDIDLWWIGWDFAHAGDYMAHPKSVLEKMPILAREKDHKWTIDELRAEIKSVLKQLSRPKKVRED